MFVEIIISFAAFIATTAAIINETRAPGPPPRLFMRKKTIRYVVIAAASICVFANIYGASEREKHSLSLQNELHQSVRKLDETIQRIRIYDKKLADYAQINNPSPLQQKPVDDKPVAPMQKGNVAGYVKNIDGEVLAHVKITRLINNAQTSSYENGEFVIFAQQVEVLRFQKPGYNDLDYKVNPLDFDRLVEIKMRKE
jgi:hypothetical protein